MDSGEHTASSLSKLTVTILKEMCKEHGLKVSGRKQELIDRLLEALAVEGEELLLTYVGPSDEKSRASDDVEAVIPASEEPFIAELIEAELVEDSDAERSRSSDETGDSTDSYGAESEARESEPEDDEIYEAEVYDAELIEEETIDDTIHAADWDDEMPAISPPSGAERPRLASLSLMAGINRVAVMTTIVLLLIITGATYWYWTSHLNPFVAEPIEYGDEMRFSITSGSFDIEGEEMVRWIDDRLNGALADVCEEFHVDYSGSGNIKVRRGDTSELLDPSDTNLIGSVQALDAYGLTYLAVEQQLDHQLAATVSSKTWLGDAADGLCNVPVGPISGYSFTQNLKSWTEISSKALLSTESAITLDNQGDRTTISTTSFGVPDDALSDLVPEILLPLKPVEVTPMFGNALLEKGVTGASGKWQWEVVGPASVNGEMGLQVNLQHSEVEGCIGRANMVLHLLPNNPWAVQQQVDIRLEKSRYDSPDCGALTEYVLDRTLPDGLLALQYTMTQTGGSEGRGMIDWLSGYGNRPPSSAGALSADEQWGNSGLHMPDRSEARDWPLEEAVECIVNNSAEAEEASAALASGGYVYRAIDDRSHGMTEWNVTWVDDNDAGWVVVEQRVENCSILNKGTIEESDRPAHRRESIPPTATLQQVESRLTDQSRYPSLSPVISDSGVLKDDATIGYLLTVPPEAGDLFDLLEGYQEGSVMVYGQRQWNEGGMDHSLSYALAGETGRMVGWATTSTTQEI